MQKNTCIVFIHSINEFHLSKNYATQTLCSRSIIQSLIASNRSTTYSSDIYLVSLGNLAHFCLVIWHTIIVIPPYIAHPTLRQTYPLLSWKYLIVLPIRAILLQLQSPPKSSFLLFYGLACSLRKHPARYSAHVICRRKRPTFCSQKKTVIAKMVISIADTNIESHTAV